MDLFDYYSKPKGVLSNIMFEVEVKHMEGQNKKSNSKKYTFRLKDFDWSDPWLPHLDITDKIEVLGDYFSDSEKDIRTITTFRMFADYEAMVMSAFKDTTKYYNKLGNNGEYTVESETCGDYKHPTWKG